MSDAIQVWWGEWYDYEGWAQDDGDDAEGATPTTRRKTRLKNYAQQTPPNPPGLLSEVAQELDGMRTAISNSFGGGAPTEKQLDQISEDILRLRKRVEAAALEVSAAKIEAKMILETLQHFPTPEGALEAEVTELERLRGEVPVALGTDGKYGRPRNDAGAYAVNAVETYHKAVVKNIADREEEARQQVLRNQERTRQRSEFATAIPTPFPNTNTAQRKKILEQRGVLENELKGEGDEPPATVEQNNRVAGLLSTFKELIKTTQEEGRVLKERKDKILLERTPYLVDPDSPDPEQKKSLDDLRAAIKKDTFEGVASNKANVTTESLDRADLSLTELKKIHGEITEAVLKSKQELTTAFQNIPGGDKLGDLSKEFGAGALQKMLPDLGGAKVVGALAQEYSVSELKTLLAEVGGAKQLGSLLGDGCGGSIAVFKQFQQEFGTATKVKELVDNQLGGKPKILAGLVKGCGNDVGRLKGMLDEFGDDLTDLTDLVTKGGFTDKVGDTEEDAVKPETLGAIVGGMSSGDPAALKKFCAAFKVQDNPFGEVDFHERMKKVLVKYGLGAKPELVGKLFEKSCKGDPKAMKFLFQQMGSDDVEAPLKTLLTEEGGLGGKPEHFANLVGTVTRGRSDDMSNMRIVFEQMGVEGAKNLNGLMKDGGLGELPPEMMGKFLGEGLGNERDKIVKLVKGYSTKEQHENLKKTLVDGGLGAKPECLMQLMKTGFDCDKGGDFQVSLTKMQGFSAKLSEDPPQHDKLKKLLNVKDGIGDQPEVFGELIATGCEKKPDSVHALLKEFDEDGLTKLNTLVKDGGFSKAPNVKAQCLGELLKTGCDKSPAELQKLVKGINDDDRKHLKGLMGDGGLGKEPKVLGHMYKTGCQKKPDELHKFCEEFKTEADQKKLGSLIGKGGFDGKKASEKTRPETLGEIMNEGFTSRGKNPGAQLKKLHDAFKPGPGDGDIGKLQYIVQSFNFAGQAQKLNGKPGKRVKTLMKNFGDDPAKLKTTFSDKIDRQSNSGTRYGLEGDSQANFLSKDELIVNASMFEFEALGVVEDPEVPDNVSGTDMEHFCQRHIRAKQTLGGRNVGRKDTTFYPEGTTPDDVKKLVEETFDKLKTDSSEFHRSIFFDKYGNEIDYKKLDVTVSGTTVRIGCKKTEGVDASDDTFSNDQFFPLSSGGLTTINSGDIRGIMAALGKPIAF